MSNYLKIGEIAVVASKFGLKIPFKVLKAILGTGNERGAASMLGAAYRRSPDNVKKSMLEAFPWWKK